jgi:hypothetical protein
LGVRRGYRQGYGKYRSKYARSNSLIHQWISLLVRGYFKPLGSQRRRRSNNLEGVAQECIADRVGSWRGEAVIQTVPPTASGTEECRRKKGNRDEKTQNMREEQND